MEVYKETSTNIFVYQGSLSSGYSLNIAIDTYDSSVWTLITPYSNSAYVKITADASPYDGSSSLTTGAIIIIVVLTVFF